MHLESTYLIQGRRYRGDSPALPAALAAVYATDDRPRCQCVEGGVEMYVAQHAVFVVKRMPGTGPSHHPSCPSYEAPASETGLGDLLGEAIIERGPERVEVRLDFPLSQVTLPRPGRDAPLPSQSVSAAQRRLSMKGLLHLLWDRAGFTRWSPRMEGKRNWFVVRKYLLETAGEIDAKGVPLASRIFVPEPFRSDAAEELKARREAFFRMLRLDGGNESVPFALLVGEVKDLVEQRDGYSMMVKHLPDFPLPLDLGTGQHLARRFERELLAKAQQSGTRLIVGCTVRCSEDGARHVDTLALMSVTSEWIPFDHALERALLDELVRQQRRFLRLLRYEATLSAAFASALLLDAGDAPVPLHVGRSGPGQTRLQEPGLRRAGTPRPWVWCPGECLMMPALPGLAGDRG